MIRDNFFSQLDFFIGITLCLRKERNGEEICLSSSCATIHARTTERTTPRRTYPSMTRGPSYFLGLHVIRTPGPACAFSRQAQRTGHRRTSFQQLFAPIVYFYAKYFSTIIRIWLSPLIINKIFFSPSHCLLLAFIRQPLPHLTPYPLLDASLISSISRPRRLLVLAPPQTRHG